MKLTMMKGLPASGKTLTAREMVDKEGNTGRINRDDLRAMLFNSKWTGRREDVVVDVEKAIARVLFLHKMNAIIDDTNLTPQHEQMWFDSAVNNTVLFVTTDLTDAPVKVCMQRNRVRDAAVPTSVICRMAAQAGLIEWGEKQIVIVDVDGTIADGTHREHLVSGDGKKRWEEYFSLCPRDKPIQFVIDMVRALSHDYTICIVSGRSDAYWRQTEDWLDWHNVPYDYIFMRRGSDRRPDVDVKNDILKLLPKEQILVALDDRPCVIDGVWRANGVRVIPVRGACEPF